MHRFTAQHAVKQNADLNMRLLAPCDLRFESAVFLIWRRTCKNTYYTTTL